MGKIEDITLEKDANAAGLNGQDDIKPNAGGEKSAKINKELEQLYALTQDAEADLRKLQSKQEYFVINYQESVKIQTSLQQIQQMPSTDPTRSQGGSEKVFWPQTLRRIKTLPSVVGTSGPRKFLSSHVQLYVINFN